MKCDPRQSGGTIPSLIRTNPGTKTQKSEKCGRQIQQSGLREPSLVWQMRDQKPKQRWVNKGSAPPLSSPCHQKRSMEEKHKKRKSTQKHDAYLLLYLLNVKYSDQLKNKQKKSNMTITRPKMGAHVSLRGHRSGDYS